MVKEILIKWVILDHCRIFIFKIFFNHGEENDHEISQIEGHSGPSSNVYFQNFLQPWWRKYWRSFSNLEPFWSILDYVFSKFSSNMVKVIIMKLVKLELIFLHLPMCYFKIFFNHGKGNYNKITPNDCHSNASSMNFQNFLQQWWMITYIFSYSRTKNLKLFSNHGGW